MRYKELMQAMDAYSVRLTPFQARMARRAGKGSLSEGIRLCIVEYTKMPKTNPGGVIKLSNR